MLMGAGRGVSVAAMAVAFSCCHRLPSGLVANFALVAAESCCCPANGEARMARLVSCRVSVGNCGGAAK